MTDTSGTRPVSIITGGGGGLGSAIADRLHRRGDVVYIVDRNRDAAEAVASSLNSRGGPGSAVDVVADVSIDRDNVDLIGRVLEEQRRLDHVINNAGIAQTHSRGPIGHAEWTRVMDVNLWSVASLTQAAAEWWRSSPGGAVVNMSSRAWVAGGPLAYAASKAGIVGLTRAFAAQLGRYNVRVNAVAPGTVDTDILFAGLHDETAHQKHLERVHQLPHLPGPNSPGHVADAVAYFASEASGFITGEVLNVAGGAHMAPSAFPRRRL